MYQHLFDPEAREYASRVSAHEALERLKIGNSQFITSRRTASDISSELVEHLFVHGQSPYAIVITCSDSRVVPEHIFMTSLGELFVIRVAGNVIGDSELASVVYAASHLHTRLVLVLGHTHCGAIEAAMHGHEPGAVSAIPDRILEAIGDEKDQYVASTMNVRNSMAELKANEELAALEDDGLEIVGGVYHIHSGFVDFLKQ